MERLNKNNDRRGTIPTPANTPRYEEKKSRRNLLATDTGWFGAMQIAKQEFGLSLSELVEQIGRGKLKVQKPEQMEEDTAC